MNERDDGGKASAAPMRWRQAPPPVNTALHVVGIAGWSGAGKTTLIERLIPVLRNAGHWVATVKHAHCGFDIDVPGKDSWRHRQAGACEVVVASDRRVAVIREAPAAAERTLDELLKELTPPRDGTPSWVLVEGFRHDRIPTIEVWRATLNKPLRVQDGRLQAVATTDPGAAFLAEGCAHLPALDLNDPHAIVAHLLGSASRYQRTTAHDPALVSVRASAGRVTVQTLLQAPSPFLS